MILDAVNIQYLMYNSYFCFQMWRQRVKMNYMRWLTSQITPGGINGGVVFLGTVQDPLQKSTL